MYRRVIELSKVDLHIVIDKELAEKLREVALKKYGKLRGGLSLVIEDALREYLPRVVDKS
jgi:hypothetical protein